MKLKKILAAVAAAAIAISTMAVNALAADIWTGSNDVDWNTNAIRLEGSLFADAKGGDTVEITYTANKDGACLKIVSNTDGWPALNSVEEKDATYGTVGVAGSGTFSFAISAEDLATVQGSGMVIQGDGATVTKVAVNGAAADEAAPAEPEKSNVAEINKDAGFIDGQTPSVTITNADFGVTDITSVSIDIAIAPKAGSYEWNDWCGNAVKVTDADGVRYYAWGGAQVTWNNDVDKDEVDDIIGGVNGDQWLGTVKNNAITLDVAVNGDFTIDIITMCYDSYDGTIYTVKTATANGTAAPAPAKKAETAAPAEEDQAEDEDIAADEDVDVDDADDESEEEAAPAAAEEAAPAAGEAAPAAAETGSAAPKTGNTAAAAMAAVMAAAGVAAVASKKRK